MYDILDRRPSAVFEHFDIFDGPKIGLADLAVLWDDGSGVGGHWTERVDVSGLIDLGQNWVWLAPKGTNPGFFTDQIQYILARWAKMY